MTRVSRLFSTLPTPWMHTKIDAVPRFKGISLDGLYGEVVEAFDFETGRLLDVVDKLGLRENTLVIYTTDNGPWSQPAC